MVKKINDDQIVISGIDGRFPNSENMEEFGLNLYDNLEMSTFEEVRWKHAAYPTLPKRGYFVNGLEKFDASLFKAHPKQADAMDPQCRMLLELAYSAILDAGVQPSTLRGSRTAVFTASCLHDALNAVLSDPNPSNGKEKLLGTHTVFLANRLSYAFDFRGPSCVLDSACASSMYAILMDVNAMRLNQCDAALVCGTNIQFNPDLTLKLVPSGILSEDAISRAFDSGSNGYARADSIVVLFLQWQKDAKRIYAEVVHALGSNDGYKMDGINTPSGIEQSRMFSKLYEEAQIDPLNVTYVEAHMTGTIVGDAEECFAIDAAFNQKRKEPLLVGGVKPNVGHSEASSALCAIAKVVHSFQSGTIPATIHVKQVRQDIPSLAEGRLKVCTENTPLPGPLVAVNSFGYGGSNTHLLLRQCDKVKNRNRNVDCLPRLVNWSGRTEKAVSTIINRIKSTPLDLEFIGLLHETQKVQIPENVYRGFGVFAASGVDEMPICLSEKIARSEDEQRPVVWLFTGMGCQWIGMGRSLLRIQPFYESILKCHNVLKKFDVDLISIITTDDKHIYDKILNSFVGITCMQIAMVDALRLLHIPVDFIIGHSNGEMAASYGDGAVTLEQAVLNVYYKGKVSIEEKTIDGLMAAVGLGYKQIRDRLPPNVYVGCRNSADSCTITGPREDVRQFIKELVAEGVFSKEVNTSQIAYHSEYIGKWVPKLLNYFQSVMPERTLRSPKWISTSVPSDQWTTDAAKYSSAEYHAKNFKNPSLFEEACEHLPKNVIIIEIGPHGLMQPIMRRSFPNAINIPLAKRDNSNNAAFFMESLGKLFTSGVDMQVDRLYPQIKFPVSRETPMISPLIKFDHEQNWTVPDFSAGNNKSFERRVTIDIAQEQYQYLASHKVDDHCTLPLSTCCYLVWETLALLSSEPDVSNFNVEFTNVQCHRPTTLSPDVPVHLSILISTSGNFEVLESREPIVTGSIKHNPNAMPTLNLPVKPITESELVLSKSEVYGEIQFRVYRYSNVFAGLNSFRVDNNSAEIEWKGYWDAFIDSMCHVFFMSKNTRAMHLTTSIRKIKINAVEHSKWVASIENSDRKLCSAAYCKEKNIIVGGGIEISGIETVAVNRRNPTDVEVLENYQFVALEDSINIYSVADAARICLQLIFEKLVTDQVVVSEVLGAKNKPVIEYFRNALSVTPLATGKFKLITDKHFEMNCIDIKRPISMDQDKSTVLIVNEGSYCYLLTLPNEDSSITEKISRQGFLIVIQSSQDPSSNFVAPKEFTLLSVIRCADVSFSIFHQVSDISDYKIISINSEDHEFTWMKNVKRAVMTNKNDGVILLSENDKTSGLLGFFNSLRTELVIPNFKCVIINDDAAPPFDVNHTFYNSQLKRGSPVNILQNGKWGTYRQLTFELDEVLKSYNALCIQAKHPGNLQSLEWVPCIDRGDDGQKIQVHYVGLSQRDIMLATGQLLASVYVEGNVKHRNVFGREFSGIDANGRVMGLLLEDGALSTEIVRSSDDFVFSVPDSMTLKEAASIPIAYLTTYSAFFIGNEIAAGQSIMIFNGCNYMGLAAIQTALTYGIDVYTTVTCSLEKEFLLKCHPALTESNINVSLDLERANVQRLNVDVVLSFKPEDQMEECMQYLNEGGMLIAVEPSDTAKICKFSESLCKIGVTLKVIFLDKLAKNVNIRLRLTEMINRDLQRGVIIPLPSNIFPAVEIDFAFRSMSTGKHNEKVLVSMIKPREIAKLKIKPKLVTSPTSVYVVPGGLGGLGLELANWLVMRGAKIIILSSRRGLSSAYQKYRVRFWNSLGCKIVINTSDITSYDGCKSLLEEAVSYGPVAGIFSLAGMLNDSIFENQTPERFRICFAPKVNPTKYLDELSRTLCPNLEHFVAYSSIAAVRSSVGQTNYAMANSIVDRIIENRRLVNLPGISIQWGPVSDSGIIARFTGNDNTVLYRGTSQLRMDRAYYYFDDLIFAKSGIVTCMQVHDKKAVEKTTVLARLLQAFGVKDIKTLRGSATLSDLGLDSMLGLEVKQIIEQETNVVLTMNEVKILTVDELKKITEEK